MYNYIKKDAMTGKKGRSGRKPSPDARHKVIQIRLTEAEQVKLKEMAEHSSGGTIASLVREKVIGAGGADAFNKDNT